MTAADLRAWRDRLGMTDREAAAALVLSLSAFRNLIYSVKGCRITARTERMTELVEQQKTGAGSGNGGTN
jgi:hypothetical protein